MCELCARTDNSAAHAADKCPDSARTQKRAECPGLKYPWTRPYESQSCRSGQVRLSSMSTTCGLGDSCCITRKVVAKPRPDVLDVPITYARNRDYGPEDSNRAGGAAFQRALSNNPILPRAAARIRTSARGASGVPHPFSGFESRRPTHISYQV